MLEFTVTLLDVAIWTLLMLGIGFCLHGIVID